MPYLRTTCRTDLKSNLSKTQIASGTFDGESYLEEGLVVLATKNRREAESRCRKSGDHR